MLYCRKCKILYRESQTDTCTCGRKFYETTDSYIEAFLCKGYTLMEEKSEREKEVEDIGKEILHDMGAENYKDLFSADRMAAGYEKEQASLEEDRQARIWAEREERRRLQQERRNSVLRRDPEPAETVEVKQGFDVAAFLRSLDLKRKES